MSICTDILWGRLEELFGLVQEGRTGGGRKRKCLTSAARNRVGRTDDCSMPPGRDHDKKALHPFKEEEKEA